MNITVPGNELQLKEPYVKISNYWLNVSASDYRKSVLFVEFENFGSVESIFSTDIDCDGNCTIFYCAISI